MNRLIITLYIRPSLKKQKKIIALTERRGNKVKGCCYYSQHTKLLKFYSMLLKKNEKERSRYLNSDSRKIWDQNNNWEESDLPQGQNLELSQVCRIDFLQW